MTVRPIEPLDPQTWLNRLVKLHGDAFGAEKTAPESLVRQAYHLIKLAPGPFRDVLPIDLDEAAIERLLDCGAFESAVMALLGQKASFSVHRDADASQFTAEVALDPKTSPGIGKHQNCAKAVLCAWVCSLTDIAGVEKPDGARSPSHRKSQSGSPPSSTAH